MKKKNKGFTLIELLAVIVILGLLMAIAIPNVTKYITQSRKKTLATTVGSYMGAMVTEVNELSFIFTDTEYNTVFAVPIECLELERGGRDPFGEWYQANDKYWAYVLVQYEDDNSAYRYGFTFKDSAGYGMFPTSQTKLKDSGADIVTNIKISKPENGKITDVVELEKWANSGLRIDSETELVVLEAESEGRIGNGKTTCTLKQKGKNYLQVEEEKSGNVLADSCAGNNVVNEDDFKGTAYALVLDNSSNPDDDLPLIFVRSENQIKAGDTYNSDRYGNVIVKAAYTGFESVAYTELLNMTLTATGHHGSILNTPWHSYGPFITSIVAEDKVRFASLVNLFYGYVSVSYIDVGNIDVSKNTSMSGMFMSVGDGTAWFNSGCHVGGGCSDVLPSAFVTIVGLEKWDTSNVTDMSYMFSTIRDVSSIDLKCWDTSKVTDMSFMFQEFGFFSDITIDLSNWNVDNVTKYMEIVNTSAKSNIILPTWKN